MPSVTIQKFLLIAVVVVVSATALGKGPFAGSPGGPSSTVGSQPEKRSAARYGWMPPLRNKYDADVYVNGMQVYTAPGIATMHDPWDGSIDY